MGLKGYNDELCTQEFGTTEVFTGPGGTFSTLAVPAQVYKYVVATGTAVFLNAPTDYSLSGLDLTLTTPLIAGELLFCLPTVRAEFSLSGSSGAQKSAVRSIWLKRTGTFVYANLLIYSQNAAEPVADIVTSSITFTSGVGTGFTGLTPGACVGSAVVNEGAVLGIVTSNTETEVTMDSNYSGTVNTRIVALGDLWFSLDNLLYSNILELPDIDSDVPTRVYVKDTVVIPVAAANYPNMEIVTDYSEFAV